MRQPITGEHLIPGFEERSFHNVSEYRLKALRRGLVRWVGRVLFVLVALVLVRSWVRDRRAHHVANHAACGERGR